MSSLGDRILFLTVDYFTKILKLCNLKFMAEYSNQEIIFIGEKSSTDTHVNACLDVSRLDSK